MIGFVSIGKHQTITHKVQVSKSWNSLVCDVMPGLACSHKLFHQMKTYDLEGEKRTQKKNSCQNLHSSVTLKSPFPKFYFLWAYN